MRLSHSFRNCSPLQKVVYLAAGDAPQQWVEKKDGEVKSTNAATEFAKRFPEKVRALQDKIDDLKEDASKERSDLRQQIEAEMVRILSMVPEQNSIEMTERTVSSSEGRGGVFAMLKKYIHNIFPSSEAMELSFRHTSIETGGKINVLMPGDRVSVENGILTVMRKGTELAYSTTIYPWERSPWYGEGMPGLTPNQIRNLPIVGNLPPLEVPTVTDHIEITREEEAPRTSNASLNDIVNPPAEPAPAAPTEPAPKEEGDRRASNKNLDDVTKPTLTEPAALEEEKDWKDQLKEDWDTKRKDIEKGAAEKGYVVEFESYGPNELGRKITLEKTTVDGKTLREVVHAFPMLNLGEKPTHYDNPDTVAITHGANVHSTISGAIQAAEEELLARVAKRGAEETEAPVIVEEVPKATPDGTPDKSANLDQSKSEPVQTTTATPEPAPATPGPALTEEQEAPRNGLRKALAIFNLENAKEVSGTKLRDLTDIGFVVSDGPGKIGEFEVSVYKLTEEGFLGQIKAGGYFFEVLLKKDGQVTLTQHYDNTLNDNSYDPSVISQYTGASKAEILGFLKGILKKDEATRKSEELTPKERRERKAQEKQEREALGTELTGRYLEALKAAIPKYKETGQIKTITPEDVADLKPIIKMTPQKDRPWEVTVSISFTYRGNYMSYQTPGIYRYQDLKSNSASQDILIRNLITESLGGLELYTPAPK